MKVGIRTADEVDLPRIVELLAALTEDEAPADRGTPLPYSYHMAFRRMMESQGQFVLVAEYRKRIVGTLVLIIVPNLSHRGSPWAAIENVVIEEKHRGKGIAAALIRRAEELARENGCYKLVLTSNRRRTEAQRFYRRLGFKTTHNAYRINL